MMDNPVSDLTDYDLRHLAAHLREAERSAELHRLLALETGQQRNAWFEAKEARGDVEGYLNDVNVAWRVAEEGFSQEYSPRLLGLQCRYALIIASLNSLAGNIPPALLLAMVKKKLRTGEQGLVYARQIPDPSQKALVLIDLVPELPENRRDEILEEALEIARGIDSESERVKILTDFVSRLPESLKDKVIEEILKATQAISSQHYEEFLVALARVSHCLSGTVRDEVLQEIQTTLQNMKSDTDANSQLRILTEVAKFLPKPLSPEILKELDELIKINKEGIGTDDNLWRLAFQLIELDHSQKISAVIRRFKDKSEMWTARQAEILEGGRTQSSGDFVKEELDFLEKYVNVSEIERQHIPKHSGRQALQAALSSAQALLIKLENYPHFEMEVESNVYRSEVIINHISSLAAFLPQVLLASLLETVVSLIRVNRRKIPVVIFINMIDYLKTPELLQKALQTSQKIRLIYDYELLMEKLLPKLSEELRIKEFKVAIKSSNEYPDYEERKCIRLSVLAPHLPQDLQGQAFTKVINLLSEWWEDSRVWMIEKLAPYLPKFSKELVFAIFQAVYSIEESYHSTKMRSLNILAPYVPKEMLPKILSDLRCINDEVEIIKSGLFPQSYDWELISEDVKEDILRNLMKIIASVATNNIIEEGKRVEALTKLMGNLSPNLHQEALGYIASIPEPSHRALPLLKLIPNLPPHLRRKALSWAINSIRTMPELWRADHYVYLAKHLPPDLAEEVWVDARSIKKAEPRTRASSALVWRLPEIKIKEAFEETLREINNLEKEERAWPWVNLAPCLSENGLSQVIEIVHRYAIFTQPGNIAGYASKLDAMLTVLVPHLKPYPHLLRKSINLLDYLEEGWRRDNTIRAILPDLPTDLQQEVEGQISSDSTNSYSLTDEEVDTFVQKVKIAHRDKDKEKLNEVARTIYKLTEMPVSLTKAELASLFIVVMQNKARHTRRTFFQNLYYEYLPLFRALDGRGIVQSIAESTVKVMKWWP